MLDRNVVAEIEQLIEAAFVSFLSPTQTIGTISSPWLSQHLKSSA